MSSFCCRSWHPWCADMALVAFTSWEFSARSAHEHLFNGRNKLLLMHSSLHLDLFHGLISFCCCTSIWRRLFCWMADRLSAEPQERRDLQNHGISASSVIRHPHPGLPACPESLQLWCWILSALTTEPACLISLLVLARQNFEDWWTEDKRNQWHWIRSVTLNAYVVWKQRNSNNESRRWIKQRSGVEPP